MEKNAEYAGQPEILALVHVIESPSGGGGAQKHFFDRDARPKTNFNYRKNRMTLNSNPKK